MRSSNFRNGVTWSYTGFKFHPTFSFHYRAAIAAIWTFNLHKEVILLMAKWGNLNPTEKSKIPKINTCFLIKESLLFTYYRYVSAFIRSHLYSLIIEILVHSWFGNMVEQIQKLSKGCFVTCKEIDHVSEIFWLTVKLLVLW